MKDVKRYLVPSGYLQNGNTSFLADVWMVNAIDYDDMVRQRDKFEREVSDRDLDMAMLELQKDAAFRRICQLEDALDKVYRDLKFASVDVLSVITGDKK